MNQRTVNSNTSREIEISPYDIHEGLKVVLVDEKQAPIAWYEFDSRQLENVGIIKYAASSVRIRFEGIKPTMISELVAE